MLNIGVIGVGYLGQHHARIYSELEGVRLAALVDVDKERARKIASKHGGAVYSDYRLAIEAVDAVSIVTPTTTHHEIAKACISAGKHVLIEKPITGTVEEADDLIRLSDETGVIVQVGHLERYNPAVLAVYPLLNNPRFFEAERLSPFLGRGIDVDITLDLMIHDIDIVLALLSHGNGSVSVKDTKATVARVLTGKIDEAKVWLEFTDGTQALLTASRLSQEKSRKLKISQENSYLLLDYQQMEIRRFSWDGVRMLVDSIPVEKREPLKEELKDFVECVVNKRRPAVSARQGRDALAIAMRIGGELKR